MSTEAKLQEYIEKTFVREKGKRVAPTDSLLDSGLVDSTGVFELVSFIESEFGIKIEDEEILPEHFETIDNVAAFISRKRTGSAS